VSASQPISPELALVSPELRLQWTRALPDVDPDELFRVARTVRVARPAAATQAEPRMPFFLAAAIYTAAGLVTSLLQGALTLAVVAGVALILTLAG